MCFVFLFFLQFSANFRHSWSLLDSSVDKFRLKRTSLQEQYLCLRISFVNVFWVLSRSFLFLLVSHACHERESISKLPQGVSTLAGFQGKFFLISIVVTDLVAIFSFCQSSFSSTMILLQWKIKKNYWRRKSFLLVSFAVLY